MTADLLSLTNEEIIERASKHVGSQTNFMATDELARRALENQQLLSVAIKVISADRTMKPHYIPYGCYLAVPRILNSSNKQAIQLLIEEMDTWNSHEQEDVIRAWAGQKRLAEATQELYTAYKWSPKYILKLDQK